MESETSDVQQQESPKSNRKLVIGIVGAVIICLCCLVIGVAGYVIYSSANSASSTLPTPEINVFPESTIAAPEPPEVDLPAETNFEIDAPPTGGLGNDILKQDTWNIMVPVAVGLGCDQPIGSESTIEVLQEPTSNGPGGVWKEKWTVFCRSGERYPFEVEYILDSTGATFNITPLQ